MNKEVSTSEGKQEAIMSVATEEVIINPNPKCRNCSGIGQIRRWDPKSQGTYTKDKFEQVPLKPCDCLIKNYHKYGTTVQPKFDYNNKLQIKLEIPIEEV